MILRPFFSYYGSKWALARHYPAPEHRTVVEPFAGSAGYACRHHGHDVVLVDSSEAVVGVWQYLIRSSPSEILRLPAEALCVDDVHACQEAKWLVGFWLARAQHEPRRTLSAWGRDGRWPMCFWGAKIRDRIARQVPYIGHWVAHRSDYARVANRRATWFVDPPYERQGRHYRSDPIDYEHLAHWCRARRGQVIACENDGANWLPFEPFRVGRANHSRGVTGRKTVEVLWRGGAP